MKLKEYPLKYVNDNYKTQTVREMADHLKISDYHVLEICKRFGYVPLSGRVSNAGRKPRVSISEPEDIVVPFKRPPAIYTNRKFIYPEIEQIK